MKLTLEQKAENKESSLLRQAAYRARCKELDQAKLAIDVSALKNAANKARAEEDAAIKARNDEEEAICEQIALLQGKLKSVNESHAPAIDVARLARNAAYQAMYGERTRQANEIDVLFPDLSGNTYLCSSNWVPPAGYIEKFTADHADELAKKKAKRDKTRSKLS